MTIVFLARLFYPHIGGVEKHVREVGKRLVKDGHKLIVITESSSQVYPNGQRPVLHEEIDGMEIYRIPVGMDEKGKKWTIWRWFWQHKEILEKADIVHCHDVFFWYIPFRLLYPSKRAYMTFHGYESYPVRPGAVWMRKIAEKLSMGNICIGDFMKKWYGTKPTYVSYGGVALLKKNSSGLPEEDSMKKKSAVFWGRLDEQTGILTYEAAFHIINKKYPQFSLDVIGNGELSNKIDHRIKQIDFQENITEYLYKNQFAFVSRYLSILEALAAKRLVFAVYDNPLKKDYVEMAPFAPFIVIAHTPEELAQKVLYFVKNPKKEQELVYQGYAWVKDQTWEKVTGTYKKLWDLR